jgi:tetratricopeptide (TPR) repeat protein
MNTHQSLTTIFDHLKARNLSAAMNELEAFLAVHPHQVNSDRLHALRTDYQLMADYWKRGFKDPQLPALYQTLLQRMYVLCANISKHYGIGHSSFLSSLSMRLHMTARDWSPQNIREELETFVSETTLLELEPEHQREARKKELYQQHQHQMNVLFDYLLTSDIWTNGFASAMEEILLSPTIDTNDQQLIVSAVMLSTLEQFDMAKFKTMLHVYERSTDKRVRQRALVGWALTIDSQLAASVYPELIPMVEQLLEDQYCCQELVELQKQIIFCINTEQDTATIQKEIMPDLMKGQQFRMTRNGIEEVEEDPMEDILHPGEQERKLEQVEESFQRMLNMQKQGSDIYFGGFSQMKRFAFFNELSNWFVPFYINHPDISDVISKTGQNRFLKVMVEKGPFCNSDKYSFVYAFQQVLDRIPESMREMLDRGEASIREMSVEEMENATYLRRIYLQDLYRFFKLFPQRTDFVNPYHESDANYLFFDDPIFSKTHLEPSFNEVAAFLLKQNRLRDAARVLENVGEARRDFQFWMMAGYLAHHYILVNGMDDLDCYAKALELQPGNERALVGYGKALFLKERYAEALDIYNQLVAICPEKKSYCLNRAVSMTNLGQYTAALQDLYRLNYESPEDPNVNRVLAWALVGEGKYEQAERIYTQLLKGSTHPDDLLNYGYCLWFSGHIDEAADCFHRFLKESGATPAFILENEADLLKEKGITEPEQQLMLYIL